MAKKMEIYQCDLCGNLVEVLHAGGGELVCCGQPMNLLVENSVDAAKEKHVPVIVKGDGGYTVKVGSVDHPMTDAHFIEFIELIAGGIVYRKDLKPGDAPEAFFATTATEVTAREFCNLHGLWRS
ncbi:MAG: desulfoferrodoxin [Proteobacteria bacterium]|nr:desulfoferrodoxin [Desulfobulbaceae bacterium]MBU4153447.1 desulfoferrodoxin [Pseudomonadota bacterium]